MQNSIVVFTFFALDQKYPFWANLVQKNKTCQCEISHLALSRPKKQWVNLQNLVQGFYKIQQCLNNNRKPYITIYIWNQHKIVYQKKLKVEAIVFHEVIDHVIYFWFFLMQKWGKKRFFLLYNPLKPIFCAN